MVQHGATLHAQGLRYEKVILATDADVDGMHIRNFMITHFFRFFEQLVHDGHVYVLETPLFRVRNKEKTIYCYSETERDNAVKELGGKPEITRFKGLGEISSKPFAQFIGKPMRAHEGACQCVPGRQIGPVAFAGVERLAGDLHVPPVLRVNTLGNERNVGREHHCHRM